MKLTFHAPHGLLIVECNQSELTAMQEAQAGTLDDKGLPSEAHLIGLGLLAEMDGERDRMIADHGACRVEVRLEWNPKPRRRGVVPIKVSASF